MNTMSVNRATKVLERRLTYLETRINARREAGEPKEKSAYDCAEAKALKRVIAFVLDNKEGKGVGSSRSEWSFSHQGEVYDRL